MRSEIYRQLRARLEAGELAVVVTVVGGPGAGGQMLLRPSAEPLGGLGSADLDREGERLGREALADLASQRHLVEVGGAEVDLFVEVHPPPLRLVLVGAVHVAVPLVEMAGRLGFRTVVIDPRAAFATRDRFPHADELHCEWPQEVLPGLKLDEGSYLAVLSHDFKIDLPALRVALPSPARYLGALGSKKTHAKRVAALEEEGFKPAEIARIRAPIGIDLGGRRAEEIALSILAQVVAATHGVRI